jgi:23S rRNA (guanosine2251-2'-O)-methyltransferase
MQNFYKALDFKYSKSSEGYFLVTNKLIPEKGSKILMSQLKSQDGKLKIICLDKVSDVHNGAAICRTAAFFGVHFVVFENKANFRFTPSFFKISSGATECLSFIEVNNLAKFILEIKKAGVHCVGLAEKSLSTEEFIDQNPNWISGHNCLVLGSEGEGISHYVKRSLEHLVTLTGSGKIETLNVSVASSLAMERLFLTN